MVVDLMMMRVTTMRMITADEDEDADVEEETLYQRAASCWIDLKQTP